MKAIKLLLKELELLNQALDILYSDYVRDDLLGQKGVRYCKRILTLQDKLSDHLQNCLSQHNKKKPRNKK